MGTQDFNMENLSKQKEREKPRALASNTSLYRVRLQTPWVYNVWLTPTGGLQEVFISVNPSPATGLAPLVAEVAFIFHFF